MTYKWQNRIDKIHEISGWCIAGTMILFLAAAYFKPGDWFLWVNGILFATALLTNFILDHWTTDEERKERKQEIKEALREMKEEERMSRRRMVVQSEAKNPLMGLTPEQSTIVLDLLYSIPEENGHIKTSLLIQFLRALKGLGKLDDQDKENLIAWVQSETGKDIDERNFKYDYDNKFSESGVTRWSYRIRAEFDKL